MSPRCNCWRPLTRAAALEAVRAELVEFLSDPSLDELDDVKVCLNRLVGSLFNKTAVYIFSTPRYEAKINSRMQSYGCIRSSRHLINGQCPSRIKS